MGGDDGGDIVATGTPEDIAQVPTSYTGQFLRDILPAVSNTPAAKSGGDGKRRKVTRQKRARAKAAARA